MLLELIKEAPEAVVSLILNMQEALVALRAEVGKLQERIAELEAQNRPPSAPFRRSAEERKTDPKKPGRREGHSGSCRKVPEVVDEVIEVNLECCPQCRGALIGVMPVVQYIEELPPVRPQVTRLTTYEGHCLKCDEVVRSVHPRQTSTAGGCAGVQLGARAVAVAAELKHRLGLTLRKTCDVLQLLGGLKVSAGGLVQAFARAARKVAPEEAALVSQLQNSPVVHADETSWWKNNASCSLWVFGSPGPKGVTLYRVVDHRDRTTFHSVIAPDYPGILISDCLSVYDTATDRQHKCYAHHLRALKEAVKNQSPQVAAVDRWLEEVRGFFEHAMDFKKRIAALDPAHIALERQGLEVRANELFANPRGDPAQESFRNRIAKQRDHLLVFLDHPMAGATNNFAERQLRGAVIARKLSCGNKTDHGASTWQTLASLAATCHQQLKNFSDFLAPRLFLPTEG